MRSAVPLITAAPLTELRGGVELFVVETRLLYPGADGADAHHEHGLTALVLSHSDETSRRRLRAEVPRYVGARAWIVECPGDDWAARVAEHLHALEPAFLDLVIGLQDPSDQAVLQACALLEQLRAEERHHLATVVAVAPREVIGPATPVRLGWVVAPHLPAGEAAILLHEGLAQLAAPDLIEEVSAEELTEVWGSAARPARLLVSDAAQLRYLPATHEEGPTAVFCLGSVTFSQYRAMAQSLRAAGIDSPLVVAAAGLTLLGRAYAGCPCLIVTKGGSPRLDDRGGN